MCNKKNVNDKCHVTTLNKNNIKIEENNKKHCKLKMPKILIGLFLEFKQNFIFNPFRTMQNS